VDHPGNYILTAGTCGKQPFFNTPEKRDLLERWLLDTLDEFGWQVQAWAVFDNHYHFVGLSPETGLGLTELTQRVHRGSARDLNKLDGVPGRSVWYRSWDTRITHERSYLARLAYVHSNPVKHGLVDDPRAYPWCSAEWFWTQAHGPFRDSVLSFQTDRVNVFDPF